MKVQILANGKVALVMSPENAMEEEALKILMKQKNEITEVRSNGVTILDKKVSQGILIQSINPASTERNSENEN